MNRTFQNVDELFGERNGSSNIDRYQSWGRFESPAWPRGAEFMVFSNWVFFFQKKIMNVAPTDRPRRSSKYSGQCLHQASMLWPHRCVQLSARTRTADSRHWRTGKRQLHLMWRVATLQSPVMLHPENRPRRTSVHRQGVVIGP